MPDLRNGGLARTSKALPREARREQEFRRARAHSKTVLVLKGALPLAAALILSLYALPSFMTRSIDNGRGIATVRGIAVDAGSLKMIEPHVRGVSERGEPYDVTAKTATQAAGKPEVMYLKVVQGKMTGADGKISTLSAPDATHDSKADTISFDNGVEVMRDGGMSATFKTASADMKGQKITSTSPVVVRLHESTINAESMTLYWHDSRAIFEGNVRTHIEREPETAPAPAEQKAMGSGTLRDDMK